jgi:hypothetical protein
MDMARTTTTADVAKTKRSSPGRTQRTAVPERAPDVRPREGVSLTIPAPVVDIVMAPFAIVGRVLPAKKGLPLYAGLGALAVAEVLEWPVAAGIGIGYAAIRRWGPQGELARRAREAAGQGGQRAKR